jgi:hypothetical protein
MKHSTFALVCSWVAIAIFRINIRVWEVIILGAFQKRLYFSCPLYKYKNKVNFLCGYAQRNEESIFLKLKEQNAE